MKNKLTIMDGYGSWAEPFKAKEIMSNVSCKFCQSEYEKRHRCNRDFTSEQKKLFQIKKGDIAIQLVVNNGPTGTSYICFNCAKKLKSNLEEQIELIKK